MINYFEVKGLFGDRDISATFNNGRAVLIGENGLGKSSFMQILFYVLTKKWKRLNSFDFNSISMGINNMDFNISKDEMKESLESKYDIDNLSLPSATLRNMIVNYENIYGLSNDEQGAEIPDLTIADSKYFFRILRERVLKSNKKIDEISTAIDDLGLDIIYFPTYRKVDIELRSLLPDTEAYRISKITDSISKKYSGEIVSFGMSDISGIINEKNNDLSREFNESVTAVMRDLLFDVLRDRNKNIKEASEAINAEEVNAILKRMGGQSPSLSIRKRILRINQEMSENLSPADQVARNFLLELVNLYKIQSEKESGVNGFVNACNEFFERKILEFDNTSYKVNIYPISKGNRKSEKTLDWNDLSSGEKQIASIFARLWLHEKKYMILIDEPELSLSVEWQRKLLPLIDSIPNCSGIIAVTHSPFVFENSFDKFAKDFKFSFGRKNDIG